MARFGLPDREGLYDPANEHDACGVGFIANIKGVASHDIIMKGIEILVNLTHRGAVGSDPLTGDGAGILMQLPDEFFREKCSGLGFELPARGRYAVGMVFLPQSQFAQRQCEEILEQVVATEGCSVLGWRDVPMNREVLGVTSKATCPVVRQLFIGGDFPDQDAFERRLYIIRRLAEKRVEESLGTRDAEAFYVPSMSSRTIVYKGMLVANQVPGLYTDLTNPLMKSAIALVHQRYSTNTFPSWPLAHPFRMVAHNGEINTLRGNINNMRARYKSLLSRHFSREDMEKLLPVVIEGGSDSACFDNVLELLVLSGRTLPHAMMMMIPEAWGTKYHMGTDRRAFYEYHSMFMEPWDGPAAMAFSNGLQVGATLDRNGLRPGRYTVTKDGVIVLASETGVIDIPAEHVALKGRLMPGKMLLVDTELGRVLTDEEVKAGVCRSQPYRRWVAANHIDLRGLFEGTPDLVRRDGDEITELELAFGYTREDEDVIIHPMANDGYEPVGSMGNDTPLAVLSDEPQLLYNYFKQLFAQVTNPPIDPIREKLVMSLTTYIGRQGNLLEETPEHARMLKIRTPILTNADLELIRNAKHPEFRSKTLDTTFVAADGAAGMRAAIERLRREAESAIADGYAVIILSDRAVSPERAPIPALLAVSAVHQYKVRLGTSSQASLILESGEPREVMHFALLLGYGCGAINPYLAMEVIARMQEENRFAAETSAYDAIEHYCKAIESGLLKIFSKMGISTLRSYRGAQIFEALGLGKEFVDEFFTNTPSRIGGIGIEEVAKETLLRHAEAFKSRRVGPLMLPVGGVYSLRRGGERHLWTPTAIQKLQLATRRADRKLYREFAQEINHQENRHVTLRSLLDFKVDPSKSIPLDEVERASDIVRRFVTGAMSFGSISREAHESMAIAMNRLGGMSNSGEGGEDRARYKPMENGDSRCSATKQVASGRFGVTAEYLVNAKELQIKMAQGAKPGEGGQLPGDKVNVEIASVRHSTPGVSLISPPPHHDIYSIEDLAQIIFDLKNVNPAARINVKLVSEIGVGTVAAGVSKGHADAVLVSGGDGGTGASPISSIKHAGIPWELGLSETQQTLVKNGLRSRIRVQTDGQMRTGRDVAVAFMLGAEECTFATAALVTLGCVMMRKCHKNTCPVGVATQDPELRKRYNGHPDYLVNYFHFVAEELREIMAALGVRTVDELVGRVDFLKVRDTVTHWKAKTLDFSGILFIPDRANDKALRKIQEQDHDLGNILDRKLIESAKPALEKKKAVKLAFPIANVNRATGTMLSGEIAKRYGHEGLAEDTVDITFTGSAGQSFGAFGANGLTLRLKGDANDYFGKGLSGAKMIVTPPAKAAFDPAKSVIIGNTAFYGATCGQSYINGLAGERFCVRNSGVRCVVEGVGDHGCEYMTGGVVVVLGRTGVNFAAGMSGGIAFVYDPNQDFDLRCNLDMVDLETVEEEDEAILRQMIEKHLEYTGSRLAKSMLDSWSETLPLFVKVMPMEYRRALGLMSKMDRESRKTKEELVTRG